MHFWCDLQLWSFCTVSSNTCLDPHSTPMWACLPVPLVLGSTVLTAITEESSRSCDNIFTQYLRSQKGWLQLFFWLLEWPVPFAWSPWDLVKTLPSGDGGRRHDFRVAPSMYWTLVFFFFLIVNTSLLGAYQSQRLGSSSSPLCWAKWPTYPKTWLSLSKSFHHLCQE